MATEPLSLYLYLSRELQTKNFGGKESSLWTKNPFFLSFFFPFFFVFTGTATSDHPPGEELELLIVSREGEAAAAAAAGGEPEEEDEEGRLGELIREWSIRICSARTCRRAASLHHPQKKLGQFISLFVDFS